MNTELKSFLLAVLGGLVVVIGSSFIPHKTSSLGGTTNFNDLVSDTITATTGTFTTGVVTNGVITTSTVTGNENVVGVLTAGTLIQSTAAPLVINTTTTLSVAQMCAGGQEILVQNTPSTVTITTAAATSTLAVCGGAATSGGVQFNVLLNESTNTVKSVAGAGVTFLYSHPSSTLLTGVTSSTFTLSSSTAPYIGVLITGIKDSSTTIREFIQPYTQAFN